MKMTKEERAAYDRYIDESRLSDSLIKTAETKGEKRGIAIGKEEGIVEGISIGEKRGDARGIRNLIETLREVSVSEPVIIEKLQQKYGLTPEEAQQYLNY